MHSSLSPSKMPTKPANSPKTAFFSKKRTNSIIQNQSQTLQSPTTNSNTQPNTNQQQISPVLKNRLIFNFGKQYKSAHTNNSTLSAFVRKDDPIAYNQLIEKQFQHREIKMGQDLGEVQSNIKVNNPNGQKGKAKQGSLYVSELWDRGYYGKIMKQSGLRQKIEKKKKRLRQMNPEEKANLQVKSYDKKHQKDKIEIPEFDQEAYEAYLETQKFIQNSRREEMQREIEMSILMSSQRSHESTIQHQTEPYDQSFGGYEQHYQAVQHQRHPHYQSSHNLHQSQPPIIQEAYMDQVSQAQMRAKPKNNLKHRLQQNHKSTGNLYRTQYNDSRDASPLFNATNENSRNYGNPNNSRFGGGNGGPNDFTRSPTHMNSTFSNSPLTKFQERSGSPFQSSSKGFRSPGGRRNTKTGTKISVSNLTEMYSQQIDSHKKNTEDLTADFLTSITKANRKQDYYIAQYARGTNNQNNKMAVYDGKNEFIWDQLDHIKLNCTYLRRDRKAIEKGIDNLSDIFDHKKTIIQQRKDERRDEYKRDQLIKEFQIVLSKKTNLRMHNLEKEKDVNKDIDKKQQEITDAAQRKIAAKKNAFNIRKINNYSVEGQHSHITNKPYMDQSAVHSPPQQQLQHQQLGSDQIEVPSLGSIQIL